ncbi:MAG: preprotein translocase subunit SecE [Candidatus Nomurabacteria bacterium]|nr:MAG: preprotein translocase subunit SecE [Candidatus Nomurabacteria bacterium]HRV75800.1 preprotein translocase subunit SecE [Candidatus Saccharimonadales bacterium]
MNLKPKKPAFLSSDKKSEKSSIEENLRPESKVVKAVNKASKKASQVGAVEVYTPTPKKGLLGKRINPFAPIKWFFRYVRDSYIELKRVTWPDRKTAWKLTGTVFLFSVIMALFLFGLDSLFSEAFKKLFLND